MRTSGLGTAGRALLALAIFGGPVACRSSSRLAPAPQASATEGVGLGATASTAGVTVDARVRAWDGAPADLRAEVTPMLVTVTNGGAVPLRVRFNELALMGSDGRRYRSIPPYDLLGDGVVVDSLRFPARGFAVAPYLTGFYPRLTATRVSWSPDPLYYGDTHDREMTQRHLPTPDMVRSALPEGVLEPGGRVAGYVYFQRVVDGTARVVLRQDLIDARTGVEFGIVTIPFVFAKPR